MGTTYTVLLIEPDRALAHTYRDMLASRGYSVVVAHHAQDAIGCADAQAPDVVVADVQLGAHNGLEFLYEFRSYAEWAHVPVVLLTGVPPHNLLITAHHMDQLGVYTCLYKPATTLLKLRQVVTEALTQAASVMQAD